MHQRESITNPDRPVQRTNGTAAKSYAAPTLVCIGTISTLTAGPMPGELDGFIGTTGSYS